MSLDERNPVFLLHFCQKVPTRTPGRENEQGKMSKNLTLTYEGYNIPHIETFWDEYEICRLSNEQKVQKL